MAPDRRILAFGVVGGVSLLIAATVLTSPKRADIGSTSANPTQAASNPNQTEADPVAADEARKAASAAGGTAENQRRIGQIQLSPSPALRNYEFLLKGRNQDYAITKAVVACGIQSSDWGDEIRDRILSDIRSDPSVANARTMLSSMSIP